MDPEYEMERDGVDESVSEYEKDLEPELLLVLVEEADSEKVAL